MINFPIKFSILCMSVQFFVTKVLSQTDLQIYVVEQMIACIWTAKFWLNIRITSLSLKINSYHSKIDHYNYGQ